MKLISLSRPAHNFLPRVAETLMRPGYFHTCRTAIVKFASAFRIVMATKIPFSLLPKRGFISSVEVRRLVK